MKIKRNRLIFILAIVIITFSIIGGALWPYTINTWLVFFEKPAAVTFWHGALLGFCPIIGQLVIPTAVFTWIFFLFFV